MQAYILRAKPHGIDQEKQFLDGRISIGWPCGISLDGKTRDEINTILSEKWNDITETSVSMVYLFVKMPRDSILLTPSNENRSNIHIFVTTSTYKYDKSADTNEIGNPHFVEAKLLKTVPRDSLPNAVLRSLSGSRKTLSRISQHYELLDDFISSKFETELESDVVTTSVESRTEAMSVLFELLSSESESIRLSAAIAILDHTE